MSNIRIEECENNRSNAITYLIENELFDAKDIGTPAMEFYIKVLVEGTDCITDVDRYAHLNTLFGYDIGFNNAMKIDNYLWSTPWLLNKYGCGVETLELYYTDKELIQNVCKEIGLNLSFDKWRTKEIEYYEYY